MYNILYFHSIGTSVVNSWQEIHFLEELQHYGYTFVIFDPNSFETISQANEQLIREVRKNINKYDFFMNAYGSNILYADTIKQIKSLGLPSLLICFDNLHVPYMHKHIAPHFDLVWLTSHETKSIFEKWDCNCIFLPYAANPYIFHPKFSLNINTVGFIGTPYGTRVDKINTLIENGVNCCIYSNAIMPSDEKKKSISDFIDILQLDYSLMKFPIGRKILKAMLYKRWILRKSTLNTDSDFLQINSSVPFEQMNALYSNFSLSLGITELWDTYVLNNPVHKLHLRTFEIPMCGGLQFVSYVEELSNYFEDEKEIVFYHSEEDYIDKAKYYLNDSQSSQRLKMKKAARYRSEHEHTWNNRFSCIIEKMGFKL